MIFCAVAAILLVIGLTIWMIKWWRNRPVVVPTPRERALDLLARIETEIDKLTPYQFSIRVSNILPLRDRAISVDGHPTDFSGIS
jgi:hypothetical protein